MEDLIQVYIKKNSDDTLDVSTSRGTMLVGVHEKEECEGTVNHDRMYVPEFEMWYYDFCDETYGHRVHIDKEIEKWLNEHQIFL